MIRIKRAANSISSIKCMLDTKKVIYLEHMCDQITKNNTEYDNEHIVLVYDKWYYLRERYADETEVDMREAKEIGQLMLGDATIITFCPFCGKKL